MEQSFPGALPAIERVVLPHLRAVPREVGQPPQAVSQAGRMGARGGLAALMPGAQMWGEVVADFSGARRQEDGAHD